VILFGAGWYRTTHPPILSAIPQVLGLDLTKSAVLSVLPWVTMAVAANVGGWLADTAISRGASVTTVRKVGHTLGGVACRWSDQQVVITNPPLQGALAQCVQCVTLGLHALHIRKGNIPRSSCVRIPISTSYVTWLSHVINKSIPVLCYLFSSAGHADNRFPGPRVFPVTAVKRERRDGGCAVHDGSSGRWPQRQG
jgi:hypothetical protein